MPVEIELPPVPYSLVISAIVLSVHMQSPTMIFIIASVFFIYWTHLYDELCREYIKAVE
jgi:hypothetical protein